MVQENESRGASFFTKGRNIDTARRGGQHCVWKQKGDPFPITPATVGDPEAHLVCYTTKLSTKQIAQREGGCGPADPKDKGTKAKQEKPAQLRATNVANQFQIGQLDTKKPSVVCLPAT